MFRLKDNNEVRPYYAVNKPVYKCTAQDGLNGAHITKARNSQELYQEIISEIYDFL